MTASFTDITCEIQADTQALIAIFEQLKQHQINLRKVEWMETWHNPDRCYLHLELDGLPQGAQYETILQSIEAALQKLR